MYDELVTINAESDKLAEQLEEANFKIKVLESKNKELESLNGTGELLVSPLIVSVLQSHLQSSKPAPVLEEITRLYFCALAISIKLQALTLGIPVIADITCLLEEAQQDHVDINSWPEFLSKRILTM